jgi:hypothetical protein
MGKSRLINEFGARVTSAPGADDAARGVRWFRGHCRAFGAGAAFAALKDVVRAHAGISADDDAAAIEGKLAAAVPEGPDAAWIRRRLRPLAGLRAEPGGRDEDFAAWRLHLQDMAGGGRLVLVLEDLDWADDSTLAFLRSLAVRPLRAPMLVLCSARPELLERDDASFFGEGPSALLHLTPLGDAEVRDVLAGLLGVEPSGGLEELALRACGNPFFVESCVRCGRPRPHRARPRGYLGASGAVMSCHTSGGDRRAH